jgi:hypothetical protein
MEPNFVIVPPDPATESVERLRRQALRLLTETGADEAEPSPGDRAGARRESDPPKGAAPSMIAGVLAMPAVFLAIVFVALAVFGKPGGDNDARAAASGALATPAPMRASEPDVPPPPSGRRGVIALPDDARIESIALDGDRLALHVESPAGREIVVYDYRDGRQIAAADIETFSTEATDALSMLTGPPPAAPAAAPAPDPAPAAALSVEPRLKPRSTP